MKKALEPRCGVLISGCGTCYWSLDGQYVGLSAEEHRRPVDDIEGVLLL
jgi:hypothetical protein